MSQLTAARAPLPAEPPRPGPGFVRLAVAGSALLAIGLIGWVPAGVGYGLFTLAGLSFGMAVWAMAVLVLTRQGQAGQLAGRAALAARLGGVCYVLAVAALAGHYAHETLQGRMELHWIVFGPLVLAALVAFEWGVYRKLVKANAVSWDRYRRFIDREHADPQAMRKTLVDEVITHRTLWQQSKLRWIRHTLIFWGFAGMFGLEIVAVFLREAVPAFGWPDLWRTPGHPVRLAFDFLYDLTGVMMLAGCALALFWRYTVRDKPERKFADTPMVLFLGFVVLSGFVVEGWRLAQAPLPAGSAWSFAGMAFAGVMQALGATGPALHQPLWLVHVVASCALIGYLPATRLIHTCATPLGRLMNSQKALLKAKKHGVLAGLWRQPPAADRTPEAGPDATRTHP